MTPSRAVVPLHVPTGEAVLGLLPRLQAALNGDGPALRPTTTETAPMELTDDDDDPITLVVSTSGSSGTPKQVLLPSSALLHSTNFGQARLGGGGSWLLCLPAEHIAGLNVLLRSIAAGREPVVLDVAHTFTVPRFLDVAGRLPSGPAFVSLVPTQLHRLLSAPDGVAALQRFTAVLVGGAATGPNLIDEARAAGIALVTSYGMSETCGGCVYDGRPLDGVTARLDDGRITLLGPVVARGYLGLPFPTDPATGERTFTTGDLGQWADDGSLTVTGRADDVVITGGVNVSPQQVEHVLAAAPGVAQVLVTSVPDAEWGQLLVAVVVAVGAGPTLDAVRTLVTATLGAAAAPKHLLLVDELPTRGPGKPDRTAVAALARSVLGSR